MNGYEAYKKYVALKLHFQQADYDYFKFSGSVKVSRQKFESRNDRYFFDRVAKLYDDQKLEQLLVANFVLNKDAWVGEVLSDSGRKVYLDWKKIQQSLEYTFTEDMKKLQNILCESSEQLSFDSLFEHTDNNWPEIVSIVFQQGIALESFIVMNKILNFMPRFDAKIEDELVWPEFRLLCVKYSPFIKVDVKKFRKIMKDVFVKKTLDVLV